MCPVSLDVQNVVDKVDPGGGQAECNEGGGHLHDGLRLECDAAGYRCGKYQDVLDPLTRAASPQENSRPLHEGDASRARVNQCPIRAPSRPPARTSLG